MAQASSGSEGWCEESERLLGKSGLVSPSEEELETLSDRLQVRLREGRGECIYEVGAAVHDPDDAGISQADLDLSLDTLR